MSRLSTLPTLYDECKTIQMKDLKRWGYLKMPFHTYNTITWSRNGEKTAAIDIEVYMSATHAYMMLDYKCNGNAIRYQVDLISKPSNLGKGVMWLFVCPKTKKHCRKLYLVDGYFFHREAFKYVLYEKQTYSKYSRNIIKQLSASFECDKLYESLYKPYAKRYYKGKPTKKYAKALKYDHL